MAVYDDFALEHYLNTNPVGNLAGESIILQDVGMALIFAGLNAMLHGEKSTGKTQFMRDIMNGYFGGNEHALWEMGRSDYKPRELFERLNISLAKGQINRFPPVKALLDKDSKAVRYFVESVDDYSMGVLKTSYKELTPADLETLIELHSITTEQLVQLANIDKHFFCIDEYNRCPQVVMDLFYGLMTGEFNHQGRIIRLGGENSFYSGMAAVNPSDYEGTFEMDAAMWARFHVVLDFTAYAPSVMDLDELTKRNLSPDVHDSRKKDLTSEIFKIHQRIGSQEPTVTERLIQQYFQSGLGYCTLKGKRKNILDWPRVCSTESCEKQSKLCGSAGSLDARAIRSVFRLAKGLKEVLRLKTGDSDLEIDPVESLVLAYKFVVPYKGVLNPKEVKEARGIEALVVDEKIPAIAERLREMLKGLKKYSKAVNAGVKKTLNLEKCFKNLDQENEYKVIIAEVEKEYTITKVLRPEEFIAEEPQRFHEMLMEALRKEISGNRKAYESSMLSYLDPTTNKQLMGLKDSANNETNPEDKERLTRGYNTVCKTIFDQYLSAIESPEDAFQVFGANLENIIDTVKKSLPKKEISFIPGTKQAECEQKKKVRLQNRLKEIFQELAKKQREKLSEGEMFFVEHFIDKFIGEK